MINRIVKLTFHEEHSDEFLEVFRNHRKVMLDSGKCMQLEVLEDIHQVGLFFTQSVWSSELALEEYRESAYFKEIWSKIKPWFSERAQAWSLRLDS